MQTTINAVVTVYAYDDKSPFTHYAGQLDGYDFHTHCELDPILVRLFNDTVVQPILFTGESRHDDRVWAELKSFDKFAGFLESVYYHSTILLVPKSCLSYYRAKFRSYGIFFREYGLRKSISDKFCMLGVYENVPGVICQVIPEPACNN